MSKSFLLTMFNKQIGVFSIAFAGALLALVVITGFVALFLVDRAMVANTMSQRESLSSGVSVSRSTANRGGSINLNALLGAADNPLAAGVAVGGLKAGDVNSSNANELLRRASGKTIQSAIAAKTGRTVSLSKIENGRAKALSSKGQQKIGEAMKRRDEVDKSQVRKIRQKLNF